MDRSPLRCAATSACSRAHWQSHWQNPVPLAPYLALLLPELGPALPAANAGVLGEAICQALAAIARQTPAALILDDLQWADNATLELLPMLASALAGTLLVVVGIYRSDEVGRRHPLRKLRNELRRANLLREIAVNPLDAAETAALAAQVLGERPGPALASQLYDRTDGIPLYVKELAEALALGGRLRPGPDGLELSPGTDLPIPDTLRDAVLLRLDSLPEAALRLLQLAAVAGSEFDLALVVDLAGGPPGGQRSGQRVTPADWIYCWNAGCWSRSSPGEGHFGTRCCVRRSTATSPGRDAAVCTGRWPSGWRPAPVRQVQSGAA